MVEGGKARSAISNSGSKTCSDKVSEFVQMWGGVSPPSPSLQGHNLQSKHNSCVIVLYLFPLLTLQ